MEKARLQIEKALEPDNQSRILRGIRRIARDEHAAEDAYQQSWAEGLEALHGGVEIEDLSSYLYRCGCNSLRDEGRSAFYRYGTQPPEVMNSVQSRDQTPLELLVRREEFEMMKSAFAGLPEQDRQLLLLRHEEELILEEMSRLTGMKIGRVCRRLRKIRGELRRLLESACGRPRRRAG